MGDPLEDMREKIDRADLHISEIRQAVEGFFKSKPYRIEGEPYDDGSKVSLRLFVLKDAPTSEIGVLVGEVIHDLRSALDQLVWSLTLSHQRRAPRLPLPGYGVRCWWRYVGFPIAEDSEDWPGARHSRLKGIDPALVGMFKEEQPFAPGKLAKRDPLLLMQELWNTDKHRTVNVVVARPTDFTFGPDRILASIFGEENAITRLRPQIISRTQRPVEDGKVVLQLQLSRPVTVREIQKHLNDHARLGLDITFEKWQPHYTYGVRRTLRFMLNRTKQIIERFAPMVPPARRYRTHDCPDPR